MARARYDVVYHQGQWKITHDGKHYGPYTTKQQAVDAAVATAHQSVARGYQAQVYTHTMDGKLENEWTYGNDPFPPRG